MKIIKFIIELIFAPFILLLRLNTIFNQNKEAKVFWVVFISIVITALIVTYVYRDQIFNLV